eukprot:m.815025 g.815025  ORF g.815025 m.815025 type:complete len:155 (+) comp59367_c0_seq9:1645-2109(+)
MITTRLYRSMPCADVAPIARPRPIEFSRSLVSDLRCKVCRVTHSASWHHGGTEHGMLCTNCRRYWKAYGLDPPSKSGAKRTAGQVDDADAEQDAQDATEKDVADEDARSIPTGSSNDGNTSDDNASGAEIGESTSGSTGDFQGDRRAPHDGHDD